MADLTRTPGNPAHHIHETYADLMATNDIQQLRDKALRIIERGGISKANAGKFKLIVTQENSLPRLQSYLTNFMLAGAGLSTGAGKRGR